MGIIVDLEVVAHRRPDRAAGPDEGQGGGYRSPPRHRPRRVRKSAHGRRQQPAELPHAAALTPGRGRAVVARSDNRPSAKNVSRHHLRPAPANPRRAEALRSTSAERTVQGEPRAAPASSPTSARPSRGARSSPRQTTTSALPDDTVRALERLFIRSACSASSRRDRQAARCGANDGDRSRWGGMGLRARRRAAALVADTLNRGGALALVAGPTPHRPWVLGDSRRSGATDARRMSRRWWPAPRRRPSAAIWPESEPPARWRSAIVNDQPYGSERPLGGWCLLPRRPPDESRSRAAPGGHAQNGTASFCEGRVAEASIYGLLHRECHRLFPDEMFADLFCDGRGRRSVPPSIVAVVMVLQRIEGCSDREAVDRFTYDRALEVRGRRLVV